MLILKQSTSIDVRMGPFVDATDGVTPETGVTLGAADQAEVLKANGAATSAMAGTFAAVTGADGWYDYTASTSDTDTVGEVVFVVQDSSVCLPVFTRAYVVEEAIYDAMFAGSATAFDSSGRVDVGTWLGNAVTFGTGGPDVNVNAISDDTAAATNLEADYDGTGYNKSNSTIGTLTTNSDKTGYSISGTKTTLDALNDVSTADVNAQCDTALSDIGLDHLISSALPTSWAVDVASGSVFDNIADDGTASYDRTTDSLQAIRDRGDTSWITGGGGGITDILNIQPIIPNDIDLANTATVRLGFMLTNAVDDLPSTAEITPGTIDIDRKAIGGTSWTSVVSAAACSESAGQIYYDEVFDSGTGYAEGDSIRITFKSQKITVAANDYEITDATGVMFQTSIRQTMRGTDSAATASALATAQADLDIITGADGVNLLSATQASIDAIETDTNSLNDTKIPQTLNLTASGNIGIDWANVENPTTAVDLSATDIQLCDTITTYTGNTVQTGDAFARLGAPAGASVSADIAALNDISVSDILTTQMTESYAADGTAPTLAQALCLIQQSIGDFAISGTTITVKKLDGSTTAATYTLDDGTSPTSRTRST